MKRQGAFAFFDAAGAGAFHREPEQRLRWLNIDGHTLAALAFNTDQPGPPLVCLHGMASSVAFWPVFQTPFVRARVPWFSLSLPGHFPGAFPPDFDHAAFSAELVADLLIDAIRRLTGDRPAILVGHSAGAFAALAVAGRCPALVETVVSIGGFARGDYMGAARYARFALEHRTLGGGLFRAAFKLLLLYRRVYLVGLQRRFATTRLDGDSVLCYFTRLRAVDIQPWLPHIVAPTLVITGALDMIVPPVQSRLVAAALPSARLVVMPGAGHTPMIERPGAYHALLHRWLRAYYE